MKKKILGILICSILILGLVGCVKNNNESKKEEKNTVESNTFKVDYASLSFAGTYDIVGNGITNERYFELNPKEKEENLTDNDTVKLFIFASLSALKNNEKNLILPKSTYDTSIPADRLNLGLFFEDNTQQFYRSSYEMNDYQYKLTNLWPKYKGGRNFDDSYILYAGSDETVYIVGEFSIKYHDIKETIKNNSTITLNWDDKYKTTFKGKDIDKNLSINDIQTNLKNKGYIE